MDVARLAAKATAPTPGACTARTGPASRVNQACHCAAERRGHGHKLMAHATQLNPAARLKMNLHWFSVAQLQQSGHQERAPWAVVSGWSRGHTRVRDLTRELMGKALHQPCTKPWATSPDKPSAGRRPFSPQGFCFCAVSCLTLVGASFTLFLFFSSPKQADGRLCDSRASLRLLGAVETRRLAPGSEVCCQTCM
ncbi:hypothetical protein AAFF_G00106080 [Aldrovandia affinis]|uniref:Uncharacterized protein n=1 Tax=Aldrovandia affinis TaxID=143900 RepID=A0AAD7T2A2_9TELE|nr:hypothetical protein AAFF_G00106080 [Aldrovandia affinis]